MGKKHHMDRKTRKVLGTIIKGFSGVNPPEWFLQETPLNIRRLELVVLMEALLLVLKDGDLGEVMYDHVTIIGQGIGKALIKEGYLPTKEIRGDWKKYFGLFSKKAR